MAVYTLGQADLLRRAMGKKKLEVLAAEFENFRDGMRSNRYSDEAVTALWEGDAVRWLGLQQVTRRQLQHDHVLDRYLKATKRVRATWCRRC